MVLGRGNDERCGFFNNLFSVAFDLRRLLRVRKEALAVCGGRLRGFFNNPFTGGFWSGGKKSA